MSSHKVTARSPARYSRTARILVVDDDFDTRSILNEELTDAGYEVYLAADAKTALELVSRGGMDLILLDIMMPEVSGLDALKAVRKKHTVADLPVIMVTARSQGKDIVACFEIGANDYMVKPIHAPVLLARIRTQLELRRLARLKDKLLKVGTHDLRNMLTTTISCAEMLEEHARPGTTITDQLFEIILRSHRIAFDIRKTVSDFLEFHSFHEGKFHLTLEPVDLNRIAEWVVDNNFDYARGKKIGLCLEVDAGLPRVQADEARLKQVVENLVGNAIKFGPAGSSVIVRTFLEGEVGILEVSDSGPGLTPPERDKVFSEPGKLSTEPTGGEKGLGLGLMICREIVSLHGGSIDMRNNPQGGATFWFELPLERQDRVSSSA